MLDASFKFDRINAFVVMMLPDYNLFSNVAEMSLAGNFRQSSAFLLTPIKLPDACRVYDLTAGNIIYSTAGWQVTLSAVTRLTIVPCITYACGVNSAHRCTNAINAGRFTRPGIV
jgi:hypothetical protein